MEINPTSLTSAVSTTDTKTSSAASVDYDAFLKLLVAELENQDPTEPMNSRDFVAQLAQFSTVEQSIQTNSKLDQMLTLSAVSRADGLIGRTVTSADGKVTGEVKSVQITQDGGRAILQDGTELSLNAGVTIS